mgnify:CR=1 FL=1
MVDSDLKIAGSINLSGAEVPDGSGDVYVNDITLDLSNIGGELQGNDKIKALHAFIDAHTTEATGIYGNNNSERTDDKHSMKITFNLWDNIKGDLNFDKNDLTEDGTTVKMADKLKNLYVESAGTTYKGDNIRNIIYTWISNAEELNSLQRVAENLNDRDALSYNYILKNDIDASGWWMQKAIAPIILSAAALKLKLLQARLMVMVTQLSACRLKAVFLASWAVAR